MFLYLIFNKMTVWVLKDNKVGSSKQAEFLAKNLDENYEIKNIVYNKFINLPNFLKPNKVGIDFRKSDNLINNVQPNVIIFAGRRLAGLSIYLKKYYEKLNEKPVKIISILNPNLSFKNFDIILLPYHDNFKKKSNYNNIINFTGALCDNNLEITQESSEYWDKRLKLCKNPFFSFIIGGDIKNKKMDPKKIGLITAKISNIVSNYNGTLLITTSRRTNVECILEIKNNLKCNNIFYVFGENNVPNPYHIFLDRSDFVFATCDSISMVSEIATFGKNLYLYVPNEIVKKKHLVFCKNIFERKIAKQFDFNTEKLETVNLEILSETKEIIKQIKQIIAL